MEDFFINLASESNLPQKYPPLIVIEKFSGVISEKDLKKISQEDKKARYILYIYCNTPLTTLMVSSLL